MNLSLHQRVDSYVVVGPLGQGGMGTVYLVRHASRGTLHALKVLYNTHPRLQRRLRTEGEVQRSLNHPNVLPVTDILDLDGSPALLMPFVDGPSLAALLERRRLSVAEVDALARPLFAGVGAAHRRGLVHRDLKPENVLIVLDDRRLVPTIADFGLAKVLTSDDGATRSGIAMGTPAYIAPEQFEDARRIDARADVFALGCMLYEMLAGHPPFAGSTAYEVHQRILGGRMVDIRSKCPDVPEGMAEAVRGALQADRERRLPDVDSLERCWSGGHEAPPLSPSLVDTALELRTHPEQLAVRQTTATWSPEGPTDLGDTVDPAGAGELPWGRATLLCADLGDAVELRLRLGRRFGAVVDGWMERLRACAGAHRGSEVGCGAADAVFGFRGAGAALRAAAQMQEEVGRPLNEEAAGPSLRVGLHAGDDLDPTGGYEGPVLAFARELRDAAHVGQVLASNEVAAATPSVELGRYGLRSLGVHRLGDEADARVLYQLAGPGLVADFPPPKTARAAPHNLPAEDVGFVGREAELAEVQALVRLRRLVSVVGPGGTGKTRLALKAAAAMLGDFPDGVFLVRLDALDGPEQVAAAVVQAVGASGEGPPDAVLRAHLSSRTTLLVLDNFEHLLAAATQLPSWLAACPALKVLVTSQAVLGLGAEQVMQLEPMRLPSPAEQTDVARLARVESVALFVQRARRADHRFALTEANAASVAEIVALLEGSPLAIELASARVRLLPVDRMALRLKRDARFLRGPVDAPERHRTLRQAVAWSVRLLPPPERRLFVRLSVFAGGFTMDAAEAVCEDDGVPDVWEAMESLVDKSLVRRRPDGGGRLSMLDAMRRYGDDALRSGGRHERYASRHARWVAQAFAEAAPELTRAGQRDAWARLAPEHANLRVALEHLASSGQLEQAVRLAHDAWRFWHAGGRLAEGRGLLEGLLQRGSELSAECSALGHLALGGLCYWQADYDAALSAYETALTAARAAGDLRCQGDALFALSTTCTWKGDPARGAGHADEALALFRSVGHREGVGQVLMAQGFAAWMAGELERSEALWVESLAIARQLGDHVEAASKEVALAALRSVMGRERAWLQAADALQELMDRDNRSHVVMALDFLAALVAGEHPQSAARLAGAADALRQTLGGGMRPESSGLEPARVRAERALGAQRVAELEAEGAQLGLDGAVELAAQLARRARR